MRGELSANALSHCRFPQRTMTRSDDAARPSAVIAPLPLPRPAAALSLPPWSVWLLSGAMAGLSVDCVLFPLDTIKTRMQSKSGLKASGGFGKLFAGIASAAAGSGPCRPHRNAQLRSAA